jgi:hypothetical protein
MYDIRIIKKIFLNFIDKLIFFIKIYKREEKNSKSQGELCINMGSLNQVLQF